MPEKIESAKEIGEAVNAATTGEREHAERSLAWVNNRLKTEKDPKKLKGLRYHKERLEKRCQKG